MGAQIDALVPELADAARALDSLVHEARLRGHFSSTLRTHAEQARLYSRFLAGQSSFPAVPAGASAHEYGLAFDYFIEPYSPELQAELGSIWRSWGGGWSPSDAVHFEVQGASEAAMQAYNDSQGVGGRVRSWAEWFNDLPWWVQVVLPMSTFTKDTPITKDDVHRVLRRFHVDFPF